MQVKMAAIIGASPSSAMKVSTIMRTAAMFVGLVKCKNGLGYRLARFGALLFILLNSNSYERV